MQRRPTLLLSAIAILVTLGIVLSTVASIAQLYQAAATISPLLAQLLVVLLVVLLAGAVGILAYYAWLFLRPKRQSRVTLPKDTSEVAEVSLQAAEQQISQIEDEIARQALTAKSQAVAQRLIQQTFSIVVFGLGSAGKTALVNALLCEMAAPVAPTLGTTQVAQTYRVAIEVAVPSETGTTQEILLTDTPGLLEASTLGEERAQAAKEFALQADLLIFVVDNDLHRAEYEPLSALVNIGKRSLLVLNKSDRYLPDEKEQILKRLKERTKGLIEPEDIVAIAANPAEVELDNGTWIKPDPDISAVVERILFILKEEGSDLIANNLLLQSQQISQQAKESLDRQRRQKADAIIERYQWIGAGVIAATPLPIVDMLATAAVNAQMVVELGKVYDVTVSIAEAKTLAISITKTMAALSITKGAMKLLAVGLQANIATAIASKLLQGVSAAYLTRIAGKSFIAYFQANQSWGDGGVQAEVEKQYQLHQKDEFVKQFLQQYFRQTKRSVTE